MCHVRALVLLVVLLASASAARAGAWLQDPGSYYLKLSASFFSTDQEFDHKGRQMPLLQGHPSFDDPSFRDFAIAAYAEYGLTARITLVGSMPWKALRSSRTTLIGGGLVQTRADRFTRGFGDLRLAVRYGLAHHPFALSVQGGLKLPLGYDKVAPHDGAVLGTREVDAEINLLLGRGFHKFYATSFLGYRRRGGRLNDELLFGLEAGRSSGLLLLKIALEGVRNTTKPPDIYGQTVVTPLPGGGGTLPDVQIGDQHFLKLNPAIQYAVGPELEVAIDLFHVLTGTDSLSGTTYVVSVIGHR